MTESTIDIDEDEIAQTIATLGDGRIVRRELGHGLGRIHIDRLQPFICVYRQPCDRADEGTGDLLLGQASYVLSDAADPHQSSLRALVTRARGRHRRELWCRVGAGTVERNGPSPATT